MSYFTQEQIAELESIFGIKRQDETLPVRDGVVSKESIVWWRCDKGPETRIAKQCWENIREYPEYYQIEKPVFLQTVVYLDAGF